MTVNKSESRIRRMFGEIAPRYDFLNHFLSFGIDTYWRWLAVRRVPPVGDASILDLCSGTGDLALAYAKKLPPGGRILGADFCHEMLTLGRQKAARAGHSGRLTFVEADAQRLPFPDNSFQIVCNAFGLRNVTDTDRGLREMTRVCQPGGRVAVLEFSMPRRQPMRGIYLWFFRHVLPRVGQAVSRSKLGAYNYLPQSVSEFDDGQALCQRMREAELTDVQFWPITLGVVTLYVGRKLDKADRS